MYYWNFDHKFEIVYFYFNVFKLSSTLVTVCKFTWPYTIEAMKETTHYRTTSSECLTQRLD